MCEDCPHVYTAPSPPQPASPALVDVDVVHTVSAEGRLGQCLNHVVTLQHHIPLWGPDKGRGQALPRAGEPTHPAAQSLQRGTFCLLSSRCTCSTKRLSLRLLTEIPEGEGQRSGIKGQSRGLPYAALDSGSPTGQVGIINPLLDLGILHDDHGTGRQQQLPGSGLVALSVIFHHRHGILRTEGG